MPRRSHTLAVDAARSWLAGGMFGAPPKTLPAIVLMGVALAVLDER